MQQLACLKVEGQNVLLLALDLEHANVGRIVQVNHEDFNEGIIQVQAKKKTNLNYYV